MNRPSSSLWAPGTKRTLLSEQQAYKAAASAEGSRELAIMNGAVHEAFHGVSSGAQKAAEPNRKGLFMDRRPARTNGE